MKLKCYQVDAFTDQVFGGNPAAVVILEEWLDDMRLRSIAAENNLSETAFVVSEGNQLGLRWFTPKAEVDLCGHATLGAAHVLFHHLDHQAEAIHFSSRSGLLTVRREASGYCMDFPAVEMDPVAQAPADLIEGFSGHRPAQLFLGVDYLAVFEDESALTDLAPDFSALLRLQGRGVIATAPGRDYDFVSRCFYPKLGVDEDPVTGSAHCQVAPYWAQRLGRSELRAYQRSLRGGEVNCRVRGERVELTGHAVTFLQGQIELADTAIHS